MLEKPIELSATSSWTITKLKGEGYSAEEYDGCGGFRVLTAIRGSTIIYVSIMTIRETTSQTYARTSVAFSVHSDESKWKSPNVLPVIHLSIDSPVFFRLLKHALGMEV